MTTTIKFLLVVFFALALAAQPPAPTPIAEVLVPDVSQSQAAASAISRVELKQALDSLPIGAHLVILTVGESVRRVFDGPLDPAHRASAVGIIDGLRFDQLNTDLAEGLTQAIASVSRVHAVRKEIIVFTDGKNRPIRGSRYRGLQFQKILSAARLPEDVELLIRLYGDESLIAPQAHIRILRTPADLKSALPVIPVATEKSPQPKTHPQTTVVLVGLGIVLMLGGAIVGLQNWRSRTGDLLVSLPSEPEPSVEQAPKTEVQFTLTVEDSRETFTLSPSGQTRLAIGGSAIADVLLPNSSDSLVRFSIVDGSLELHNDGSGVVTVGQRHIRSGKTLRLPEGLLEMRIGGHVLHVSPESVQCAGVSR